MSQNEVESEAIQQGARLVPVGEPEVANDEAEARTDAEEGHPGDAAQPDELGVEGDAAAAAHENLLAASEARVARKGGRLAWTLVVVLALLLAGSAVLNWLQYEALDAAQSGSSQMATALGAAQERTARTEAELRSLATDIGQGLGVIQGQVEELSRRLQATSAGAAASEQAAEAQEAAPETAAGDQTSTSTTSAE